MERKIDKAVTTLINGNLIVYPTETCYGIGADATNKEAIKKVYTIKQRPQEKPLTIIVSDTKMAEQYCSLNKCAKKLIKKYMPGPLTLIVKKKSSLPSILTANKETVGFRITGHRTALDIVKKFNRPITATSANISGHPPIYTSKKLKQWQNKVDYIVDTGDLEKNPASTIYDTLNKKVVRKGPIAL